MRFLSLVVVICLIASVVIHVANGSMAALAAGKHYAVQDQEAAKKAIEAQRNANANRHANANRYNNAANIARAQEANADRVQSLAEKKQALADKENSEHDIAKDILASDNAGLYRKKRSSVFKKDVLDETRAWRNAKLIGREREKDRANRDRNDANEEKNVYDKNVKSAAAKTSNAATQGGADANDDSNSAAGIQDATGYGSGINRGSDTNYGTSYYV